MIELLKDPRVDVNIENSVLFFLYSYYFIIYLLLMEFNLFFANHTPLSIVKKRGNKRVFDVLDSLGIKEKNNDL